MALPGSSGTGRAGRVAVTPKTIMTSLGPDHRRARYRSGASGASPVPVDESLGLVDDYLTRPAAELGLLMMGHCTAREAAAFFAKTGAMTPSVSTLQRLTLSMHECWESLGLTLGSILGRDHERSPIDSLEPGTRDELGQGLARGRRGFWSRLRRLKETVAALRDEIAQALKAS